MKQPILFSFWTSVSWGLGLAINIFIVWIMTPSLEPALGLALSDVEYISEQIERFHSKTHQYPKTHEALVEILYEKDLRPWITDREKLEGLFLLIPMEDPWGQKYRYLFPGIHHETAFDLFSLGQDGQPNTRDDINNWDQSKLGEAYAPFLVRKLFRDNPLLGILLFWSGIILLMEVLSIIMRQGSLLKQAFPLFSSYMEGFIVLGSVVISAIFLLTITLPPTLLEQIASDRTSISVKLSRFHSKHGQYPHTHEELFKVFSRNSSKISMKIENKAEGSYLFMPIKDHWGRNYRYRSPGLHHPESFDLWSSGADGQLDTLDDVKNWDESWREYYGPGPLRKFLHDHPLWGLVMFWLGIALFLKWLEWLLYKRNTGERR